MQPGEIIQAKKTITATYRLIKDRIIDRLLDFERIWDRGDNDQLFIELVFCLLTPQSKSTTCWLAVEHLIEKNLVFQGEFEAIRDVLQIVRFKNNKAKYILEAREQFIGEAKVPIKKLISAQADDIAKRTWLVEQIKGIGLKESSHFLRNIGVGRDIAILDRHVLRNMRALGLIEEIPKTIKYSDYFKLETLLRNFSESVKIPLSHLDFVLLYKETGLIFK